MTETKLPRCQSTNAVLKWCNYHQRYEETPCGNSGAGQH